MRLFVAVPLPEEIKEALKYFQEVYSAPGVKLIPEANLHLTLHFIGDFPDEKITGLIEKLEGVAERHLSFELNFKETAPGPQLRSPRLIWTRFQEHTAFAQLATDLCTTLNAAPGAFGKFIPHITIARFSKDFRKTANLPVIRGADVPNLKVTNFALWQSQLQSPNPVYTTLKEFSLSGTTPPIS